VTTNQDIRQIALTKALESITSFDSFANTETILERATAFEKYLRVGTLPEGNVRAKED